VTFTHSRATWVAPAPPITGPSIAWHAIDTVVIHYTGADDLIDGDPGENADRLDDYLRAMQRSYVQSRGYSVGYNAAIDWLGGSWELRGLDIQCAANKGHNGHTWAVLVLVDGNDAASSLAVAEVRRLIAAAERLAGRTLKIIGHGQLPGAATACPGIGLRAQITAGVFSPGAEPTQPEADEMPTLYRDARYQNVFLIGGGPAINVSGAVMASYVARGVPVIVDTHDQMLRGCVAQSGLSMADLVPA
jgi:hypothetical protein